MFVQNLINGTIDGATIALMALALVIIFKTTLANNFSLGIISVFAAYLATAIVMKWNGNNGHSWWMVLIAVVFSVILNFVIGFFIDNILFRFSKNIDVDGKQMITMGLIFIFTGLIAVIFNPTTPRWAPKFTVTAFQITNNISIDAQSIINFVVSLVILIVIFAALKFTKWGLGVRATASNETVASMMSVNTRMITGFSWGIGAAISAIAAITFLQQRQFLLGAEKLNTMMIYAFLALVLGGTQTFHGPVIASFIFSIVLSLVTYFTRLFGANRWDEIITFALVMIVILIKPTGLFGKKIAKKV